MAKQSFSLSRFVRIAFSRDFTELLLSERSRAGRQIRLFLKALASKAFARSDLDDQPARTVDRRIAEWRRAGILQSVGRRYRKLSWNTRLRALQRVHRDRRGYRRGRPEEQYRIVDPLERPRKLTPEDLLALARLYREPAAAELHSRALYAGLRMLTSAGGREALRSYVVPAMPPELGSVWKELLNVFEGADPGFAARVPDEMANAVAATAREWLPKLADKVETIAVQAIQRKDSGEVVTPTPRGAG